MLTEIHLQNYRCFNNHVVPFKDHTLVVGRNNAGKSTLLEALRLIAMAVGRYKNINFTSPPPGYGIPSDLRGVRPSLEGMGFPFDSLYFEYGEPPAIVEATFANKESIRLYLAGGAIFAVLMAANGDMISTRKGAQELNFSPVNVLPLVGPLQKDESMLRPDYVRANMNTLLAPLHFRNQINLFLNDFPAFKNLSERTWPGLEIREFVGPGPYHGDHLGLTIRDGSFVAEAAAMGHGLQCWLQTMWFLARSSSNATVILDEPDIYAHPELQRRLIRLIRQQFRQSIVATHSVEMMAEVDPSDILVLERRQAHSNFLNSQPALQGIVDRIGGIYNIQLAKVWNSQRFLLVEGDDLDFLSHFHQLLYPQSMIPLSSLPHVAIGGWGGWNMAVTSPLILRNAVGEEIKTYCVLDSDYHLPEEITERRNAAGEKNINLHIWSKKEIENYLLQPEIIARVVKDGTKGAASPTPETIAQQLDIISEELREKVQMAYGTSFQERERRLTLTTAIKRARDLMSQKGQSREAQWGYTSGKEALSRLSTWSKDLFGVSFSAKTVLHEFQAHEIPAEIRQVLTAIETSRPLS